MHICIHRYMYMQMYMHSVRQSFKQSRLFPSPPPDAPAHSKRRRFSAASAWAALRFCHSLSIFVQRPAFRFVKRLLDHP